jgi:hypothetical protein
MRRMTRNVRTARAFRSTLKKAFQCPHRFFMQHGAADHQFVAFAVADFSDEVARRTNWSAIGGNAGKVVGIPSEPRPGPPRPPTRRTFSGAFGMKSAL